jgi:hypothetical protein
MNNDDETTPAPQTNVSEHLKATDSPGRRGPKPKPLYDDAYARIQAGELYDEVMKDVQSKDPDISVQAFYQAMNRREYRKKKTEYQKKIE